MPLLLMLLVCVGCSDQYPLDRPYTWRPTGANDSNLRAMIANPGDLEHGEAATTERGSAAAIAATRLFVERRRPLLTTSTASGFGGQQQNADQPLPGLLPSGPAQ
jgi:hypothetical protein